jgi:hypothetical protein
MASTPNEQTHLGHEFTDNVTTYLDSKHKKKQINLTK